MTRRASHRATRWTGRGPPAPWPPTCAARTRPGHARDSGQRHQGAAPPTDRPRRAAEAAAPRRGASCGPHLRHSDRAVQVQGHVVRFPESGFPDGARAAPIPQPAAATGTEMARCHECTRQGRGRGPCGAARRGRQRGERETRSLTARERTCSTRRPLARRVGSRVAARASSHRARRGDGSLGRRRGRHRAHAVNTEGWPRPARHPASRTVLPVRPGDGQKFLERKFHGAKAALRRGGRQRRSARLGRSPPVASHLDGDVLLAFSRARAPLTVVLHAVPQPRPRQGGRWRAQELVELAVVLR